MPGPAHKPIAAPGVAGMMAGFDPNIDAESACAIMGIKLEDIVAELNFRHRRKLVKLHAEMAQAWKEGGERKVLRCQDGDGGEFDLQIHPASYHYWGQRLGYECWNDPQFIREYKRDNPSSRVRTIVKPTIFGAKLAHSAPNARRGIHGRRGRWAA